MAIQIIVQSLNNKTIDLINSSDFSKKSINSNQLTSLDYNNWILNIHSNVNSFTLNNFWINVSNVQRDVISVVLFAVSIFLIFLIISFVKSQGK